MSMTGKARFGGRIDQRCVCVCGFQLSHGGIIMLKNVNPDEEEDLVEFVQGKDHERPPLF